VKDSSLARPRGDGTAAFETLLLDGVNVPQGVHDELMRQFGRMGYARRVGELAVAMMSAADAGILTQLEHGLAALDASEARRPELAEALARQRTTLVDNALALAQLTREQIVHFALYRPVEMADPAFWQQDSSPGGGGRKHPGSAIARVTEPEDDHAPWEEFAIGLTAGLWRPRRGRGR
jgi:hypothetical protein